jgi:hypothetical protein
MRWDDIVVRRMEDTELAAREVECRHLAAAAGSARQYRSPARHRGESLCRPATVTVQFIQPAQASAGRGAHADSALGHPRSAQDGALAHEPRGRAAGHRRKVLGLCDPWR